MYIMSHDYKWRLSVKRELLSFLYSFLLSATKMDSLLDGLTKWVWKKLGMKSLQNYALQLTVSQSSNESDDDFQERKRQSLSCWYVYSLSVITVIVFLCLYSSPVTYLLTVFHTGCRCHSYCTWHVWLVFKRYQYPALNGRWYGAYVSLSEWKAQLRELQLSIDTESLVPTANMINVLRGNVLEGYERALHRSRFCPLKKLDIRFVDVNNNTKGVDNGAPLHEFCKTDCTSHWLCRCLTCWTR